MQKKESLGVEVVTCASRGKSPCPRCKKWTFDENYDNLCNRCVGVLLQEFPEHPSSKMIMEIKKIQEENNK